jgi:undecaprenyl-diphosphatase
VSWRQRSWAPGVLIVGTVAAATAASTAMKVILGRARPPMGGELVAEVDWSYPSGHVSGIVALAGALLVVLGARVRTTSGRVSAGAAIVFVVTVVSGTRLYLGACGLTDVIGGVLLGAAVASAASLIAADFAVSVCRLSPSRATTSLRTTSHLPCPASPNAAQIKRGVAHGRRPDPTR